MKKVYIINLNVKINKLNSMCVYSKVFIQVYKRVFRFSTRRLNIKNFLGFEYRFVSNLNGFILEEYSFFE